MLYISTVCKLYAVICRNSALVFRTVHCTTDVSFLYGRNENRMMKKSCLTVRQKIVHPEGSGIFNLSRRSVLAAFFCVSRFVHILFALRQGQKRHINEMVFLFRYTSACLKSSAFLFADTNVPVNNYKAANPAFSCHECQYFMDPNAALHFQVGKKIVKMFCLHCDTPVF